MFFGHLAVAALSLGTVFAAPVNVDPKVGDVTIPTGAPTMIPRVANVADALAAVTDAANVVQSNIESFDMTSLPMDEKAVQLATDMVKLEECINGAKAAISGAQGGLPLVDVTSALSALKRVEEGLQSVPSLKTFEVLGTHLPHIKFLSSIFKSSVDGLVSEVTSKANGADFHDLTAPISALDHLLL